MIPSSQVIMLVVITWFKFLPDPQLALQVDQTIPGRIGRQWTHLESRSLLPCGYIIRSNREPWSRVQLVLKERTWNTIKAKHCLQGWYLRSPTRENPQESCILVLVSQTSKKLVQLVAYLTCRIIIWTHVFQNIRILITPLIPPKPRGRCRGPRNARQLAEGQDIQSHDQIHI